MKVSYLTVACAAVACYASPALAQEREWSGLVLFAEGGPTAIERTNDPVGYPAEQKAEGHSVGGGFQYNWETGQAVFGVEVLGHALDAESRSLISFCHDISCAPLYDYHRTVKGEWDASVVLHAGWQFGADSEFRPYVFWGFKGVGIAETFEDTYPDEPSWNFSDTKRSTAVGETYGVGIDWSPVDGYFIGVRHEIMDDLAFGEYASGFSELVGGEVTTIRVGFLY